MATVQGVPVSWADLRIVIDVADDMDIMQREIFGPLLPVKTYRSADEVAARAAQLPDQQSPQARFRTLLPGWVRASAGREQEAVPLLQKLLHEDHWDEAVAEAGLGTARVWRLYMAASRLGFDINMIQLHQMLGVKLGPGGESGMPLRPGFDRAPASAGLA